MELSVPDALAAANDAVAEFASLPAGHRNPGAELLARLHQASAHLLLDNLDGGEEVTRPVLATAPQHHVTPLLRRTGELHALLRVARFRGSPLARDLTEHLAISHPDRPTRS